MNAVNTPDHGPAESPIESIDPGESHSRAIAWAKTMHGFDNDGIRFAHADSWAGAGSTHIVDRRERHLDDRAGALFLQVVM